jgi:hypothetical protein
MCKIRLSAIIVVSIAICNQQCMRASPNREDRVNELTTSNTSVAGVKQARVIASEYMRARHLQGKLSEGGQAKSGGWVFLVNPFGEEVKVGSHFFIHVLENGTVELWPGE